MTPSVARRASPENPIKEQKMPETEKIPFFQRQEFNCWLITSFFTVFVAFIFAVLPVVGVHRLSTAVGDELSRYDEPMKKAVESQRPVPIRRQSEGIPVAYRPSRTGP